MERLTLVQRCPQGPMQPIFQVEIAAPRDDVGEQIAVEGGILVQQRVQIERALGGDQVDQPQWLKCDRCPIALRQAMVGVGPAVADSFEDHPGILCTRSAGWPSGAKIIRGISGG